MGQIKNIKLHIVTDIKVEVLSKYGRRLHEQTSRPGKSFEAEQSYIP